MYFVAFEYTDVEPEFTVSPQLCEPSEYSTDREGDPAVELDVAGRRIWLKQKNFEFACVPEHRGIWVPAEHRQRPVRLMVLGEVAPAVVETLNTLERHRQNQYEARRMSRQ